MGKYAILIVSALIFSMLTYSYALRNAVLQSNLRTVQSYSLNQAQNIAQSAAMLAYNSIRSGENNIFEPNEGESFIYPLNNDFQIWPELNGEYRLSGTNQGDSLLIIQSTGLFEQTSYNVSFGVVLNSSGNWNPSVIDQAVHAESEIDLGNGEIDGDATLNQAYNALKINRNGSITGDFQFYNDALEPGNTGIENSSIGKNIINMPERIEFDDPIFPDFPNNFMPLTENGSKQELFPSDIKNLRFKNFNTNNTTINIGDEDITLHAENIDLSGGLTIIGEGTLSLYVEESINLGNAQINSSRSPKHLAIYYKGTQNIRYTGNGTMNSMIFAEADNINITIGGNPTFEGHIIATGNNTTINYNGTPAAAALTYAPKGTVTLGGSAGSYHGAIVSDKFNANGRPVVTYDPDFASTMPPLKTENVNEYNISFWN
ncbi:MAG: hypothetical protein JJU37_12585 [Balneolaceae bacterium]|nr:hypothetical protein [Balneolaceae bacterium]